MALDDRQHVEAVAIMRRLAECVEHAVRDTEALIAAEVWLGECHPDPEVYMAAVHRLASGEDHNG